jgi:hypothetical protein
MREKWWIRLAGCCAIELAAALVAAAAGYEYKAGTGEAGRVRALALEDRRGNRAVIVEAAFKITLRFSDVAAAHIMQETEIERGGILIRSSGTGEPEPGELAEAVREAFAALAPARVLSGGGLSVEAPDGACRAFLSPAGDLAFRGCRQGEPVAGGIRVAFEMVEPPRTLGRRGDPNHAYPVQAIALGRRALIAGIPGAAPHALAVPAGSIMAAFSNHDVPFPAEALLKVALRRVLRRVGR